MNEKILVHACCAPCTTATLEEILTDYPDAAITVFYYNPNIFPAEEEEKRFQELDRYLGRRYGEKIGLIRGKYDFDFWNSMIEPVELSGEGGFRCRICYYLRLLEAFKKARETGATHVTTTLAISPYKNFEWLDEIGKLLSAKFGITWFLKRWNYRRSIELSKEYGLYRQKYCGCEYSKRRDLNISK